MKLKVRKSKKENLKFWDLRTFSCEIIAENSKFVAKKFANQNYVYFDKSLKEFKLWNSRIPRNSSLENLEFLRLKYPRTPKNLEFLRQNLEFLGIKV